MKQTFLIIEPRRVRQIIRDANNLRGKGSATKPLSQAALALAIASFITACGDGDGISENQNQNPQLNPETLNAVLTASPNSARMNQDVLLDAQKTIGVAGLEFSFQTEEGKDYLPWSTATDTKVKYTSPGEKNASVKVRSPSGKTASASVKIKILENQAAIVQMNVHPVSGPGPLLVTVDFQGTTDPDSELNLASLKARVDFDGDGHFDAEGSADQSFEYTLQTRDAPYLLLGEVEDSFGAITQATREVQVGGLIDLDADTNRDGVITPEDEENEDHFSQTRGAILLPNLDADIRIQDSGDEATNDVDVLDMAEIVLQGIEHLPDTWQDSDLWVSIADLNVSKQVRIFEKTEQNGKAQYTLQKSVNSNAFKLRAGDVTSARHFFVESIAPRLSTFDGKIAIEASIKGPDGTIQRDQIELRVAPIIFPSNLEDALRVFMMRITSRNAAPNPDFVNKVEQFRPRSAAVLYADQNRYSFDRWSQDNMQTGIVTKPGPLGTDHLVRMDLNTIRGVNQPGLYDFVHDQLAGIDHGYYAPTGGETGHNYGGNIEILPPYIDKSGRAFPFGRLIIGGGNRGTLYGVRYQDSMTTNQRAFLDAQIQGPTFEVSTEWLFVGHVDEIFQVVPAPKETNGRSFKFVFASPKLALSILQDLSNRNLGDTKLFEGRDGDIPETTANALLNKRNFQSDQLLAQERIDTVRMDIMNEMGLSEDDFIDIPVLYRPDPQESPDLWEALSPGMQNLVTLNNVLLIPDPEGPTVNGQDLYQQEALRALTPLGLDVQFVDIFESYHVLIGEAHCGSEVERKVPSTPWWTVDQ